MTTTTMTIISKTMTPTGAAMTAALGDSGSFSKLCIRSSQVSPVYPSMQPPKQLPLVMEQLSISRQRPHVSLQFEPYHPTSQVLLQC